MRLPEACVDAFLGLLAPAGETPEALATRAARFQDALAAGRADLEDVRVLLAKDGALRAAVRIEPLSEASAVLAGPWLRKGDATVAKESYVLVHEGVARARTKKVAHLLTRPRDDVASDRYRIALAQAGFLSRGGRMEFAADVASLPSEEGTPLSWQPQGVVGESVAVETLRRAALGDPQGLAANETAGGALAEWLADPVLTTGPTCVHVGFQGGVPVAFVCAQIRPTSGWSRITYLGLVPEARRQGLGRWVHRHGFAMMKAQGGRAYHGGTSTDNAPMLALFRAHACRVTGAMTEWSLELPPGPRSTPGDQ